MYYILDGHEPQPCDDLLAWGQFMADLDARIVEKSGFDGYHVSTVFLGLDHGLTPSRPVLFETLIFDDEGTPVDGTMRRAATWAEAQQNHDRAEAHVREVVEISRQALKP